MIDIGVIGIGGMGRIYLQSMKKADYCRAVAVVDANEKRAEDAGKEYGVAWYTDYKNITTHIDAVILNLPHFLHCEAACFFLEKGIDVLVEKPMAVTYSECKKMMDAAEKSGAKLAVAHVQRFFAANKIVKKFYDEKMFGDLCMTTERRIVDYFTADRPKWFLSKASAGGGIVMNYGAHALDKLMYITGSDIREIHGLCGNFTGKYDVEGNAQILVDMDNGVSSSINFCGYPGATVYDTTYYFENAAVKVYDSPGKSNNIAIARNGTFEKYIFAEETDPFAEELHEFIKYTENKESNIATSVYSAKIIAAIEKVYSEQR